MERQLALALAALGVVYVILLRRRRKHRSCPRVVIVFSGKRKSACSDRHGLDSIRQAGRTTVRMRCWPCSRKAWRRSVAFLALSSVGVFCGRLSGRVPQVPTPRCTASTMSNCSCVLIHCGSASNRAGCDRIQRTVRRVTSWKHPTPRRSYRKDMIHWGEARCDSQPHDLSSHRAEEEPTRATSRRECLAILLTPHYRSQTSTRRNDLAHPHHLRREAPDGCRLLPRVSRPTLAKSTRSADALTTS